MKDHQLEVFFDGDCPLCLREINWLKRRDTENRVRFTDLMDPNFDPQSVGKTHQELMDRIHGRLPDGSWTEGVDLFIRLYELTGLKWLANLLANRALKPGWKLGYRFFAKYRLTLTGRRKCQANCTLGTV